MQLLIQIIGWVGTFLILLAYYLVSNNKVDGKSVMYQAMNLVGAICMGINVFYQQAWPAVALQTIWGVIAIISLIKR